MPILAPQSDLRSLSDRRWSFNPITWSDPKPQLFRVSARRNPTASSNGVALNKRNDPRLSVCTADELHYVPVTNSGWNLALWRYLPSPQAEPRNHPLLLLSGLATNAIGYDLSPESSFARSMSAQGYDTWVLEFRGAGLSAYGKDLREGKPHLDTVSKETSILVTREGNGGANDETSLNGTYNMVSKSDELQLVTNLMETFKHLPVKLSTFLNEGLFSKRFADFQARFSTTLGDFQKQLDLMVKFDWDFDHYLEEDLPIAMEYVRTQCKPKDGKLLGLGHSMGGILLYARLSQCSFQGRDSGLASVATLGSSLDYTQSRSSLKLLLPLADPAQVLNVPVPCGAIAAAVHRFAAGTQVSSWFKPQVSAQDMMEPELYEKLVLNNFCTVPAKLLLQLATAFQDGGLCDRSGTFFYKDHLWKSNVPILALGGDQDLICPLEAVYGTMSIHLSRLYLVDDILKLISSLLLLRFIYGHDLHGVETVKDIPEELVTFKVLGEASGPHYAHYDLVGGRLAADTVYPYIIEFLNRHDRT